VYLNHVTYSTVSHYVTLTFSAKISSLVLTIHKTLLIDWQTHVQNIMQPSFSHPH